MLRMTFKGTYLYGLTWSTALYTGVGAFGRPLRAYGHADPMLETVMAFPQQTAVGVISTKPAQEGTL